LVNSSSDKLENTGESAEVCKIVSGLAWGFAAGEGAAPDDEPEAGFAPYPVLPTMR
jgi:hypothetical protein